MTIIDTGGGLVIPGPAGSRPDILAQARAYLVDAGVDAFTADSMLVDRHDLIHQAWWMSDGSGFVAGECDGAELVVVVNASAPHVIAVHDARHAAEAAEWAQRAQAERDAAAAHNGSPPAAAAPALTRFPELLEDR